MRKFVVKNRQKRKYVRKAISQPSYVDSKTIAGILPLFILCISFITMVLMNLNLRDQDYIFTFRFELPFNSRDITTSLAGLPNILSQPVAFTKELGVLLFGGIIFLVNSAFDGLSFLAAMLDPRQIPGIVANFSHNIFSIISETGLIVNQAIISFFTGVIHGISIVSNGIISGLFAIRSGLTTISITIALSLYSVFMFIFTLLAGMFAFIGDVLINVSNAITSFFSWLFQGIFSVVRIPFDAAGSLWKMVEPYALFLGDHIKMAGVGMQETFGSLGRLSESVSQSRFH